MSIAKLPKQFLYASIIFFLALYTFTSCQSTEDKTESASNLLPSVGCAAPWADSVAMEFVTQVELATRSGHAVWPDYKLGDGAIVLNAGLSQDSSQCLGLWKNGQLVDFLDTTDKPRLATPLYGYHLNFANTTKPDHVLNRISQQPSEISQWLNGHDIESAVIMPVDFPEFPFKIPALKKMQIAIHESFHVEVMLRYWLTGEGNWPGWDEQPDRKALRQCYALSEEVTASFKQEKETQVNLIEALLDENKQEACARAQEYLDLRQARYEMVSHLVISKEDSTDCDCKEAEMIMELEEGMADYASWTMLYDIEVSSKEELLKRYSATQNEPFYLTGAMLMHAIALMSDTPALEIIDEMNQSESLSEGSLLSIFERTIKTFCDN